MLTYFIHLIGAKCIALRDVKNHAFWMEFFLRTTINIFLSLVFLLIVSFSYRVCAETIELNSDTVLVIHDKNLWKRLPDTFDPQNIKAMSLWYDKQQTVDSIIGQSGRFVTKLTVSANSADRWFLVPNTNFIDHGLAYYFNANGLKEAAQEFSQLADNKTPQLLHFQAFNLMMDKGDKGELWVVISAQKYPSSVSIKLLNSEAFYRFQSINNMLSVAAIFAMLLLALLTLFIYLGTRNRIAITCAGYLGFHGIGWAAASGLIDDVFNLSINTVYLGMYIFPLAIAFAAQFVSDLFECKHNHRKTFKFLYWLSVASAVAAGVIALTSFSFAFAVSHMLAVLWIAVTIVIGIHMLKLKDFRAKYFLFGNLLYGLSLIYYMLSHSDTFGELDYAESLVVSALAIDCICIMLSLTEWFKIKQSEYNRNFYLSRLDPLTKLGNRYALNEGISKLGSHYVVVYLDIDGLKKTNDNLGHGEGDKLITFAAEYLLETFSSQGSVFRTGGDEFVILLPQLNLNQLSNTLKSTQALLVLLPTKIQEKWAQAGISFGICDSTEQNTPSQCLSQADKRMYLQKEQRRDKHSA